MTDWKKEVYYWGPDVRFEYEKKIGDAHFTITVPLDFIDPQYGEFRFFISAFVLHSTGGEFEVKFEEEFESWDDAVEFCEAVGLAPHEHKKVMEVEAIYE